MSTPYWPPPPIDNVTRTDTTPAHLQHPKDHNDIQVAINAILVVMGQQPYGASATLTAELARLQTELDTIVLTPGPQGPPGTPGTPGVTGSTGPTGTQRFYGAGPPGVLIGARPADEYVNTLTGDLYILQ